MDIKNEYIYSIKNIMKQECKIPLNLKLLKQNSAKKIKMIEQ